MSFSLRLAVGAVVVLAVSRDAFPETATRLARVDGQGVMRWTDDASEVSCLGVNYYPPFSVDYRRLTERGLDIEEVMRNDVAHFRRLGLDCLRLHCYDRQFSTRDGAFVANDHVAKLDYLIALCASNGIYTVLTPIAWWGKAFAPGSTDGFSNLYTMEQMTSDRNAWLAQARFLREFARHVNPHTGLSYGRDPAVLAFELINEPHYPTSLSDDELVEYVNTLADALRAGGTSKPIFYNSWEGRHAAVVRARIDGETNSDYPLGLRARHERFGDLLGLVRPQQFVAPPGTTKLARMIYEFDTADTSAACLYPAIVRSFRHQGVQVANQFQYDALPLAAQNRNWDTHYLNLVYTPAKALSLAIAVRAFHLLPRGCSFSKAQDRMSFPPFCVDEERNLSEFVTDEDYWYTGCPLTLPPNPDRLRRVYGVGRSKVADCTGEGVYFLDKAGAGVWRLQLYPDVFQVNDPYDGRVEDKVLALDSVLTFGVHLPDLGSNWLVRRAADGVVVARATEGRVMIRPGDYVLVAGEKYGENECRVAAQRSVPRYVVPPLSAPVPLVRMKSLPREWGTKRPLVVQVASRNVERLILSAISNADDREIVHRLSPSVREFPLQLPSGEWRVGVRGEGCVGKTEAKSEIVKVCGSESEWRLFKVADALKVAFTENPRVRRYEARDEAGRSAVAVEVAAATNVSSCAYAGYKVPFDSVARERHFPATGSRAALLLHARAGREGERVEIVFTQADGTAWGKVVTLSKEWKSYSLPVADLYPCWNTAEGKTAAHAKPEAFVKVNLGFGDWLFGKTCGQSHLFEVSDLSLVR